MPAASSLWQREGGQTTDDTGRGTDDRRHGREPTASEYGGVGDRRLMPRGQIPVLLEQCHALRVGGEEQAGRYQPQRALQFRQFFSARWISSALCVAFSIVSSGGRPLGGSGTWNWHFFLGWSGWRKVSRNAWRGLSGIAENRWHLVLSGQVAFRDREEQGIATVTPKTRTDPHGWYDESELPCYGLSSVALAKEGPASRMVRGSQEGMAGAEEGRSHAGCRVSGGGRQSLPTGR